jgi:CRP/FNR family transcriptional regulator, anaerobic regulatory protein
MYTRLLEQLNRLVPLTPNQRQDLCNVIGIAELSKHQLLLEAGTVASHIHFVDRGIIRSFYCAEYKDVTRWFCLEGHFCASHMSFVTRAPSEDSLVAVTDCRILSISYECLQYLLQKDTVWVDLNRLLLVQSYNALLERVMTFQTQSAAERYEHFLREQPGLEDNVALGHIASYLGMTQETLSRLRARRKKRKLTQ